MTANQIAYRRFLEEVRHNAANEMETRRSNRANEQLTLQHNQDQADYWSGTLDAKRQEIANAWVIDHERLGLQKATLNETVRSNIARENETYRSNRANENETVRYHDMMYGETVRSNVASETENRRHNLANEALQSRSLGIQAGNLALGQRTQSFYETQFVPMANLSPQTQNAFDVRVPYTLQDKGPQGTSGAPVVASSTFMHEMTERLKSENTLDLKAWEVADKWTDTITSLGTAFIGLKTGKALR